MGSPCGQPHGAGNAATAGAQVPSHSVQEVLDQLVRAIDQYFEDE